MNTLRPVILLLLAICTTVRSEPLRIAVAANFKPTLETITEAYSEQNSDVVTLSSASTGVLTAQIQKGAPFDLFFAADSAGPKLLAEGNNSSFCYAHGRLSLAGGEIKQLADPANSVAIANPVTAPYGRAASEVLARPEFETGSTRKLVRANNAAQAYQFWHSGSVDLALLPRSLAPDDAVPIPAHWHSDIAQHAYIARRSEAAQRYLKWFRSDTVRSLIQEAGYEPCP